MKKLATTKGQYVCTGSVVYEQTTDNRGSSVLFSSVIDSKRAYFQPLLSAISIDLNGEGRVDTIENGIKKTYGLENGEITRIDLNEDVRRNQTVDTSTNTLMAAPVKMLFNFTDQPITLYNRDGSMQSYDPIHSHLSRDYKNNIFLVKILYHPNPIKVRDRTGVDYYPEKIINEMNGEKHANPDLQEFKSVMLFLLENKSKILNQQGLERMNSIQTVSVLTIGNGFTTTTDIDDGIYVEGDDSIIKSGYMGAIPRFPISERERVSAEALLQTMKHGSIQVFINDPSNEISARYISCAGIPIEVERLDCLDDDPGMYILSNGEIQEYLTLDEVRSNKCIFTTKEEAVKGGDITSIAEHSRKLELLTKEHEHSLFKLESSRAKTEAELIQHQNKIAELQHSLEIERASHQNKMLEAENKIKEMSYRSEFSNRQEAYENKKYERDTHLAAIKTIGAITVSAFALYTAYAKLSN